jgi:hypothetical protein
MSWILGYTDPHPSPAVKQNLRNTSTVPLHVFDEDYTFILFGGIPETLRIGQSMQGAPVVWHWAVCGLGIETHASDCEFIGSSAWQNILTTPEPDLGNLDGHFVACRWRNDVIEFFTDQFGLRTIFFARLGSGFVFSTKLHWLARITRHTTIDFGVFGPHWIGHNQLSSGSFLKDVSKLGPAGCARIKGDAITIQTRPWLPSMSHSEPDDFAQHLLAITSPRMSNDISLGLSGGLDSRLLLSIMLHHGRRVKVHTFGPHDGADARIASRIAKNQSLRHMLFEEPRFEKDICWDTFRSFARDSMICESVMSALNVCPVGTLNSWCALMIDGGFGEISRRQYLNRLLLLGKRALVDRDPGRIMQFITLRRAMIFNHDTEELMKEGFQRQITSVFDEMPDPEHFGVENFIDLLAVRTRFPNWGGAEQARLDGIVMNYMPLAQPSLINCMFGLRLRHRKNGSLYKSIVKKYRPALARIPLAKSGVTYPFFMGLMGSHGLVRMKHVLFGNPSNSFAIAALRVVKENVFDLAHGSTVREYPPYNHGAILRTVEHFYKGEPEYAEQLAWWLAFELWRQSTQED